MQHAGKGEAKHDFGLLFTEKCRDTHVYHGIWFS